MIRRLALPSIVVVVALSASLAACNSTPVAPALTDPKEIVSKAVTSLTGVKTLAFTGTFSGSAKVAGFGSFDLSTARMSGAVDLSTRNAKFSLDAPSLLGTKIDAVIVGGTVYYRASGAIAALIGGSSGKYVKMDLATASGGPIADATDVTKLVTDLEAILAKLSTPPMKAADEKCGDQDCYHVSLTVTQADLTAIAPSVPITGSLTADLLTRKSDYRPARLTIAATTAELGTIGATIEIQYDVSVNVAAPAADQVGP